MPMKPGMMMLMNEIDRRQRYSTSEYGGGNRRMIGYDRGTDGNATTSNYGGIETESRRRRDSRGRYMEGGGGTYNGGYDDDMPNMGGYGYDGTEARRRRDSRGRYMMGGMDYDGPEMRSQTWYPPSGHMPPNMHGGSGYSFGDVYADIHAPNAMNRPMHGSMEHEWAKPVDEHTARMWVAEMKQPNGGKPMPAFKIEETEAFRKAHCPECDMWEFFVAMNMRYSDEFEVTKKFGVDRPEYYADLAKSFLMDDDAGAHKLRKYMTVIHR